MKTYIYILINPLTDEIFYVGKTNAPEVRFTSHCTSFNSNKRKDAIIKGLKDNGLKPIMDIVEEIDSEDYLYAKLMEIYWMHQAKSWGFNITNISGMTRMSDCSIGIYYVTKRRIRALLEQNPKDLISQLLRVKRYIQENYNSFEKYEIESISESWYNAWDFGLQENGSRKRYWRG